jgi:hypothetical protein
MRGERLPLDALPNLFRSPKCGNLAVKVTFEVTNQPKVEAAE